MNAPTPTDPRVEAAAKALYAGPAFACGDGEPFGDNSASDWCRDMALAALTAADAASPAIAAARLEGAESMREECAIVAGKEAAYRLEIKQSGHGAAVSIAAAIRALDLQGESQ